MLQCSRGLSLRAGHEVVATPGLVVARAQFVEQEPERMQWIVEFVQHRRKAQPRLHVCPIPLNCPPIKRFRVLHAPGPMMFARRPQQFGC